MTDNRLPERSRELALTRAVQEGQEAAIEEFAERLRCVPRIMSAQNARLGRPLDEHDLADVVQDTIVVILKKLREFAGSGPLEGWIFRVCCLEFMNGLRRQRRRRQPPIVDDAVVDNTIEREQEQAMERERIHRAIAEVGGNEAETLRLKYLEGLTFDEMAVRLAVSANTLKARYYRGMERLERILTTTQGSGHDR